MIPRRRNKAKKQATNWPLKREVLVKGVLQNKDSLIWKKETGLQNKWKMKQMKDCYFSSVDSE